MRILVVEDEPAIQELLRVNLEDAGFAVRTVADAETLLRSENFDILLFDLSLPDSRGPDSLSRIWSASAECSRSR